MRNRGASLVGLYFTTEILRCTSHPPKEIILPKRCVPCLSCSATGRNGGYIQSPAQQRVHINATQGPPMSLRTLRHVRLNYTRHPSSVSHNHMSNLHYTALLFCRLYGPRLCLWSSTRLSTCSREPTRCGKLAASPTPLESASAGARWRCWALLVLLLS